eukprot:comp19549_c0_seq1/m.22916 comp19549_c0_seq1/g.22916  ORF comp19549_c0_seq1/g.22916 comp19549_c0_seq1/m.22916 type:complete len:212 (-) comp19549_c0_seq1:29-664(-)
MHVNTFLSTLVVLTAPFVATAADAEKPAPGFEFVTCGSTIKLTHRPTAYKLHSHDVKYGSGSGQQTVTGMWLKDDINSYWLVKGAHDKPCVRAFPIKCGDTIRLTHVTTKKNLHTHLFTAPMSGHQEVSAFGDNGVGDGGDNWVATCSTGKWKRMEDVALKHVDTGRFLTASHQYKFNRPIEGQLEVAAKGWEDRETVWFADEGLFMKAQE